MDLLLPGLQLAIGLALLILGARVLVDVAQRIAQRYGISELVVGLALIGPGTSLPEMIVSLLSALDGHPGLAIGTVLGSNISNTLLILGTAALVRELPVRSRVLLTELPFTLIAMLLLGFLGNAAVFFDHGEHDLYLSRADGFVMLGFLLLFAAYLAKTAQAPDCPPGTPGAAEPDPVDAAHGSWAARLLATGPAPVLIAIGIGMLWIGGDWSVTGATTLGLAMGISSALIGLTVVAIGTSLPELVTSVIAAKRGATDIAIGNILGSNIFNVLWILGTTAVVVPLPFDTVSNTDIVMAIFASAMIIGAVAMGRRGHIDRRDGVIFLLTYAAYIGIVVMRG